MADGGAFHITYRHGAANIAQVRLEQYWTTPGVYILKSQAAEVISSQHVIKPIYQCDRVYNGLVFTVYIN